ncbi:MAG: DUF922 domain-containing protein [Pseudomonadota bacterium]
MFTAAPAMAGPSVRVTTQTYAIRGRTAAQLKQQMARRGPQGYWAYARWNVRWTANCKVTVRVRYTMPRWANKASGSARLRQKWRRMMRALRAHENQHGRHGIQAARELVRTRCRGNPHAVVARWAAQDRIFDQRTNHGVSQGVRLD